MVRSTESSRPPGPGQFTMRGIMWTVTVIASAIAALVAGRKLEQSKEREEQTVQTLETLTRDYRFQVDRLIQRIQWADTLGAETMKAIEELDAEIAEKLRITKPDDEKALAACRRLWIRRCEQYRILVALSGSPKSRIRIPPEKLYPQLLRHDTPLVRQYKEHFTCDGMNSWFEALHIRESSIAETPDGRIAFDEEEGGILPGWWIAEIEGTKQGIQTVNEPREAILVEQ